MRALLLPAHTVFMIIITLVVNALLVNIWMCAPQRRRVCKRYLLPVAD